MPYPRTNPPFAGTTINAQLTIRAGGYAVNTRGNRADDLGGFSPSLPEQSSILLWWFTPRARQCSGREGFIGICA